MFIPYAAKIIANIVARGLLHKGASVVEMGNQTYSVDAATVKHVIATLRSAGVSYPKELEGFVKAPAASRPAQEGVPLVSDFLKALGFGSYTAIDINTRFGSLVMDLNKDLKE